MKKKNRTIRRARKRKGLDFSRSLSLQSLEERLMLAADLPEPVADFDFNGSVDGRDFLVWQRNSGTADARVADADGDGQTDDRDLAVWRTQYDSLVIWPDANPTWAAARGDFDGNRVVDGKDLLAWQRSVENVSPVVAGSNNGGVTSSADLDAWRTNFGSTLSMYYDEGVANFTVDLLDPAVSDHALLFAGADSNDTLVLEHASFSRSAVLSLSGPNAGKLAVNTPAGTVAMNPGAMGSIDFGGMNVDIGCVEGLDEEFVLSANDEHSVHIVVNGRQGPQLHNFGQLTVRSDEGDKDHATVMGAPMSEMQVELEEGMSTAIALHGPGSLMLEKFPMLQVGDSLNIVGSTVEIAGTPGDDDWQLSSAADGSLHAKSSGVAVMLRGVESVSYDAAGGNDSLAVDLTESESLLSGGAVSFVGGAGDNKLSITGAAIQDLQFQAAGRAGTLRAGNTNVVFSDLMPAGLAAPTVAQATVSYVVDETSGVGNEIAVPLDVGPQNRIRELSYEINASLIGNDRAEFWIVDAHDHANILLGGINGAPMFSLEQDGHTAFSAEKVNYVGDQLHVDVSSLATTAEAELLVRLVDVDGAAGSRVAVMPMNNDFQGGLLTMDLAEFDLGTDGVVFESEWLGGAAPFSSLGSLHLMQQARWVALRRASSDSPKRFPPAQLVGQSLTVP